MGGNNGLFKILKNHLVSNYDFYNLSNIISSIKVSLRQSYIIFLQTSMFLILFFIFLFFLHLHFKSNQ